MRGALHAACVRFGNQTFTIPPEVTSEPKPVTIFIDEVNPGLAHDGRQQLPGDAYWVRQAVNTAAAGARADIVDLVLENKQAVVVIENYFTSDGHGHREALDGLEPTDPRLHDELVRLISDNS